MACKNFSTIILLFVFTNIAFCQVRTTTQLPQDTIAQKIVVENLISNATVQAKIGNFDGIYISTISIADNNLTNVLKTMIFFLNESEWNGSTTNTTYSNPNQRYFNYIIGISTDKIKSAKVKCIIGHYTNDASTASYVRLKARIADRRPTTFIEKPPNPVMYHSNEYTTTSTTPVYYNIEISLPVNEIRSEKVISAVVQSKTEATGGVSYYYQAPTYLEVVYED